MLSKILSYKFNKPSLISILSTVLLIFAVLTRTFGIPNEIFYALYFGIFIFIITTIKVRNFIVPKTLFLSLILTYLLTFTGLVYFYFERDSAYTQQLLSIIAIFKLFCSIFVLYIVNKYSKGSSWLGILNLLLRISILVGAFQWITYSLGFNNLSNILQKDYNIVGFFPIIRINSIYPENQHFASVLLIYLYSNYQLAKDKFQIRKSNLFDSEIRKEAIREKSGIFFKIALILLILGGSTTSLIILIYLLLTQLLISNNTIINIKALKIFYSIKGSLANKINYKNLFLTFILTITIIFLLVKGGERIKQFTEKQLLRVQLITKVLTLSDSIIDPNFAVTSKSRANSFDKAIKTFKNPTLEIPPYRRDSRNIYKDGLIKNISKYGFIGSLLFMFSFIVPLFFNTSRIGIIMFTLLIFLYWGKGSAYPQPDVFTLYLYSYFVNLAFCKK